jgi:hypothetical protein
MAKNDNTLLYVGIAAVGAYFIFSGSGTSTATSALSNILPGATGSLVGINSGIRGGSGDFYTVSNYAALLSADPNLGNPQYQMSAAENAQYIANYQDLQTGLALFVQQGGVNGFKFNTMPAAAQYHWTYYGCSEKRIFLPLQPPSTAAYVAPPPPPKSATAAKPTTQSWITTGLQVAGTLAMLLGPNDPQLSTGDLYVLLNASGIIKNILPFYLQADGILVDSIENKMNSLIAQYVG